MWGAGFSGHDRGLGAAVGHRSREGKVNLPGSTVAVVGFIGPLRSGAPRTLCRWCSRSERFRGRRPAVRSPAETLLIHMGVRDGVHGFCAVPAGSRFRFVGLFCRWEARPSGGDSWPSVSRRPSLPALRRWHREIDAAGRWSTEALDPSSRLRLGCPDFTHDRVPQELTVEPRIDSWLRDAGHGSVARTCRHTSSSCRCPSPLQTSRCAPGQSCCRC